MKELTNTVDVIEQLGGNQAVAKLLISDAKAVANWRYFGIFPANTYVVLKKALRRKGFTAPDGLWNMKQGASPREQANTATTSRLR